MAVKMGTHVHDMKNDKKFWKLEGRMKMMMLFKRCDASRVIEIFSAYVYQQCFNNYH